MDFFPAWFFYLRIPQCSAFTIADFLDQRLTERVTRLLPVLLKINALSLDEQLSGAIFSFLRAAKVTQHK
jgi:Na+(H+)/acetate symporter ActP